MNEHIVRIEPAAPPGHLAGMGLLRAEDARDTRFAVPRTVASGRTFRSWLTPGPVLDQGGTSQCVIFMADKLLTAHRTVNRSLDPTNPGVSPIRTKVYKEVQGIDEWPGDDYDGTSVRAMMKWLQRQRQIERYGWAQEVKTAQNHLLDHGPLAMGTNWSWDMFQPDKHGYVYYNTETVGGHAWLAVAINLLRRNPDGTTGAVRGLNSWGRNWGQAGRFWIPLHAFSRLIRDWGECATPVEVKLAA